MLSNTNSLGVKIMAKSLRLMIANQCDFCSACVIPRVHEGKISAREAAISCTWTSCPLYEGRPGANTPPAKWPEFLTEAELVRAEKRLSSLVPLSLLDLNSGTDTKSCVSLPKPSTPKES